MEGGSADQMPLDVEGVVNCRVGSDESPGLELGFEMPLLTLSSSNQKIQVLRSIILPGAGRIDPDASVPADPELRRHFANMDIIFR